MSERPIFRFAPSPNGYLHLGHAYSALLNAKMARASGGRLLLRVEDIDIARCRPEHERAIYDDLAWLGVEWEQPVRRQSEHFADYAQALGVLRERGLIYPCFCTRGDISRAIAGRTDWPRDPDGSPLYPGTCRHLDAAERSARLAAGKRVAWRLDTAKAVDLVGGLSWSEFETGNFGRELAAEPGAWGDVVLARRDVGTSYHISVVVDDAKQGVTDIVRGKDLFASTGMHRLLQVLLRLHAPRYHHHDLIIDANGHKLSKSRGSPTLRDLRASGMTSDDIRRAVGL
ncbi:MAG: tRNA glutamyl-Q(34) synthetase GluQRS [Methylobacteriaceae bacterium]|nr:tRNA glutamyl-Q(34) synthetase GluQRS [Methylobacteriaceae bacterium]